MALGMYLYGPEFLTEYWHELEMAGFVNPTKEGLEEYGHYKETIWTWWSQYKGGDWFDSECSNLSNEYI